MLKIKSTEQLLIVSLYKEIEFLFYTLLLYREIISYYIFYII